MEIPNVLLGEKGVHERTKTKTLHSDFLARRVNTGLGWKVLVRMGNPRLGNLYSLLFHS